MLKVHYLIIRNQNLYYRKKLNLNNINTINQYNNEVKYHWLYLNNNNYLFHYKCNYISYNAMTSSSQIILKFGSIGNTLKMLCDDLELNNFPITPETMLNQKILKEDTEYHSKIDIQS